MPTQTGSLDLKASKAASEGATKYLTQISGTTGISVHDANDTSNFVNVNSNGMKVYKGGTSDSNVVASFGDSVRIGKEAYGHVFIDSYGLYVKANDDGSTVSGSTDVSYITSNGIHVGNDVTRIFSSHNPDAFSGEGMNTSWFECHSSNGIDSVVYAQTGMHAIADTLNKEGSVTVHANDDTGNTYTIITGDDLYIESNTSISGSLTLGGHDSPVGTMLSNSASVAITTANINTYAVGPGITLSPGSWIIRGIWQYNSATGARVIDIDLATDNSTAASTTTLIARQRVSNATGAWARLEVISLVTPTADTPVYVKGSATLTSTAQACYIYAMRIA